MHSGTQPERSDEHRRIQAGMATDFNRGALDGQLKLSLVRTLNRH